MELKSESTESVVTVLKSNFARYGIPLLIYTDGGPQFSNYKFKAFAAKWNFSHVISSPYYARSNGMVERYVGTCKNMLNKAEKAGLDPYVALLEYRNTPIDSKINKSPSEIMFGRNVNAFLPVPENFMAKSSECNKFIKKGLEGRQLRYKHYHDQHKHNKPLTFKDGEVVYIKDKVNNMTEAQVVREGDTPRSYKIRLPSGNIVNRNRYNMYKSSPEQKFILDKLDSESGSVQNQTMIVNDAENDDNVKITSDSTIGNCSDLDRNLVTRSGRNVKKPKYLSDYILEK